VVRPSEQADDSEVFFLLTQKGAEMAKRVAAGKVYLFLGDQFCNMFTPVSDRIPGDTVLNCVLCTTPTRDLRGLSPLVESHLV